MNTTPFQKLRVVFLGDTNVGKTTTIKVLYSGIYPKTIELTLPPIHLQSQYITGPFYYDTILVDTCNDADKRLTTNDEIKRAHIAVILYDVTSETSAANLKSIWLQKVASLNENIPIILLGTKTELTEKNSETDTKLNDVLWLFMQEFPQLEAGLEFYPNDPEKIVDLLFTIQKHASFPIRPLYDYYKKSITEGLQNVMLSIFDSLDTDGDGLWSIQDIKNFQNKIYCSNITDQEVTMILDMVEAEDVKNSTPNVMTKQGFLNLQKKMIEMGKSQAVWEILTHYNYVSDRGALIYKPKEEVSLPKRIDKKFALLKHTLKQPNTIIFMSLLVIIFSVIMQKYLV